MSTTNVYDGAPKLEVVLGGAGSPGGPAQTFSPILTQLVAEVARLSTDLENMRAGMEATIARQVEAKVKEQLAQRDPPHPSPPAPSPTPSPTAPQGTLRLSRVWQGLLVLGSLPAPGYMVMYAITGDKWYQGMGAALICLSLSCITLFFFASPTNKKIEWGLVVYASLWLISYLGGAAVGNLITDKDGVVWFGWIALLGIPIAFGIIYFGMLMRRKIGAFSRPRLQHYISNTVFLQGILGCLPPIIYFTSESVNCLFSNMNHEGNVYDVCGGVITPTLSITVMLLFFLFVRIIFVPLDTDNMVTSFQLASFKGLSKKLRLQMILIAIAGFINLVMFGLIDEGPYTPFMGSLLWVCFLAILLLIISELLSIVFRGKGGVGEGGGGAGDHGMEVLDRMHTAASGGLDVV